MFCVSQWLVGGQRWYLISLIFLVVLNDKGSLNSWRDSHVARVQKKKVSVEKRKKLDQCAAAKVWFANVCQACLSSGGTLSVFSTSSHRRRGPPQDQVLQSSSARSCSSSPESESTTVSERRHPTDMQRRTGPPRGPSAASKICLAKLACPMLDLSVFASHIRGVDGTGLPRGQASLARHIRVRKLQVQLWKLESQDIPRWVW